jgi:tryptophan 2,3-dioxygenase
VARRTTAGTDYTSYLLIDDLLDLQRPLTPGAHDEMLFIVVHHAYELWFKLLLWKLGRARDELIAGRAHTAVAFRDQGTGGSMGVGSLRTTVNTRFFPDLWEARTAL